ncbi:hypothetical protein UP10_41620 [Bradyrhizobium sp. LTSPM299]|nr:hypothetical protein UP10_41620 [Bradyrhizobium sp. LTSPM299]
MLEQEFAAKLERLDPLQRSYIDGYAQALLDDQRKALMNATAREERARHRAEIRRRLDLIAAADGLPRSAIAKARGGSGITTSCGSQKKTAWRWTGRFAAVLPGWPG